MCSKSQLPEQAANPNGKQQLIVATELRIATAEAETLASRFVPLPGFEDSPTNQLRRRKVDVLRSRIQTATQRETPFFL